MTNSVEEITVAYVNEPKQGAKTGTVKTADGRYFRVWPDKLGQFAPGGMYRVEYESRDYEGKTYHTIKKVLGPNGPTPATAKPAASGTPSMTKSEEMFVMGVIGRTLQGTGSVPDGLTMAVWVKNARMGWKKGFAASLDGETAASKDALDDPVPF